ncbi:MAG: flagellar basal body rod C-terminal domain-containing protein, partial [Alphaproteobacteria bacterium]
SIIEEMNGKISTNLSLGRPVGDLEDERDRALATLSENIDITSYTRETGEVIVLLGNGRPLSNGGAATLSYAGAVGMDPALHYVAPGDPDYVALNATNYPSGGIAGILLDSAGEILDATPLISSGRIRGLLDLRDQSLPNLNEEIDALAREIRDALNVVHNGGSGLPAPATLTGSHTWASGIASSTGTIRIAAVDGTGTLQGDALHLDLSGLTWPATLADIANAINTAAGTATPVTASVVTHRLVITADTTGHGVAINQGNSAMAGTGRGFSEYMGLNDLFTTSTDIHIMTGTVARAVVAPGAPADPTGTTTITVQDDDGATVGTLSLDLADAAFTYPATLASFAAAITSIANGQGLPITAAASGTSLVLQANDSTHAITLGSESVTIDGASTTLAAYFGLTPTLRGSEAANIALRSDIETNPAFFSRGLLDTATARSTGPALAGSVVPGAIAAPTAGTLELTVTNADGTVQGNTLSLDLVNDITYPATLASYVNDINTAAGIQGVAITATVSGTGTLVLTSNDSTLHVAVEELGVDMDGAGQSFVAAFGLPQNSAGVSAGDARNVISLSQAFTGNQTFAGAGGLAPMQTTLAGYGSAIVALNAANAANAIDDHAFRDLLFDNTEYKASSVSGVNVDQELAEMMMLQNAYSAAARVLNTASDMLRMLAELAA